jgi:predicted permease
LARGAKFNAERFLIRRAEPGVQYNQLSSDAYEAAGAFQNARPPAGLLARRQADLKIRPTRFETRCTEFTPMLPGRLRSLRSSGGTVALAFATLTLAIAVATTTFSVVDAIVLRRLPFPDEGRLVAISRVSASDPAPGVLAPQDFFAWQAETSSFESLGAVAGSSSLPFGPAGQEARLRTLRATSSFLDALGVRPVVGRVFTAEHERAGSDGVALISHRLWVRHFGANPAAIGTTVSFGRASRQILGVMPPEFTYPVGGDTFTDVWIPFVPRDNDRDLSSRGRGYYLQVVGRLRPGASLEQARADVERVRDRIEAEYPSSGWKDRRVRVVLLRDHIIGPAKGWMLLVLGAVGLVLLVACLNVANLLLLRATSRQRDLAVRTALGASRGRLFRDVLLESVVLAAASAGAGVLMAVWGVDLVRAFLPEGLARASDIAVDGRVLTMACVAAAATALVSGLLPAWHTSRADVVTLIKGDAASGRLATGGRLRSLFLVAEVAFVATLLVATALLVSSFVRVSQVDLGFEPRNLMGFRLDLGLEGADDERLRELAQTRVADVIERVSGIPGVVAAGVYDGGTPLTSSGVRYSIAGFGSERGEDMVDMRAISPGYLQAAGMRIVQGRPLLESDAAAGPRVALVNDVVARRFFPGQDPVGRTIDFRGPVEIVGVVGAVRVAGPEVAPPPELFMPLAQHPQPPGFGTPMVVVRLAVPPQAAVPAIQAALQDGLPAAPQAREPFSFEETLGRLTAQRRFSAGLMVVFGVLALLIGAAGVYAVMAFVVAQRTREIGIRIAVGASAGRVLRTVLAQAGRHLVIGLALGLLAAWAASGIFSSVLFEVQPTDPLVYALAAGVLLAIGLVASIVPAMRATRVDPLVALRTE